MLNAGAPVCGTSFGLWHRPSLWLWVENGFCIQQNKTIVSRLMCAAYHENMDWLKKKRDNILCKFHTLDQRNDGGYNKTFP